MGYITCKHCGCQMSDKSEACPVCGNPVWEDVTQKEAAIFESNDNKQEATHSAQTTRKNKILLIAFAFIAVVAIVTTIIIVYHNNQEKQAMAQKIEAERVELEREKRIEAEKKKEAEEMDLQIRLFIEKFSKLTETSSSDLVYALYAPHVKRYASAYDKDVDYVAGCYSRYDEKFGVYGKHSSVRWNTVSYNKSNDIISLTYIEDYTIDRFDPSKYSVFVLEKHFELDENYKIISVYDVQLSKSKK